MTSQDENKHTTNKGKKHKNTPDKNKNMRRFKESAPLNNIINASGHNDCTVFGRPKLKTNIARTIHKRVNKRLDDAFQYRNRPLSQDLAKLVRPIKTTNKSKKKTNIARALPTNKQTNKRLDYAFQYKNKPLSPNPAKRVRQAKTTNINIRQHDERTKCVNPIRSTVRRTTLSISTYVSSLTGLDRLPNKTTNFSKRQLDERTKFANPIRYTDRRTTLSISTYLSSLTGFDKLKTLNLCSIGSTPSIYPCLLNNMSYVSALTIGNEKQDYNEALLEGFCANPTRNTMSFDLIHKESNRSRIYQGNHVQKQALRMVRDKGPIYEPKMATRDKEGKSSSIFRLVYGMKEKLTTLPGTRNRPGDQQHRTGPVINGPDQWQGTTFHRVDRKRFKKGNKENNIKAVSYTHLTLPTTPYV